MSYLEAGFIILGTVLAWPLISGAAQGVSSILIAWMFPAERVNVKYTNSDGVTVKKTIYTNDLDVFFEELKSNSQVPDDKES